MENLENVEQKIKEILDRITETIGIEAGNKEWTKRIKEEICKLGESYSYDVSASGYKDTSEWLFDLIWWKDSEPRELVLAMECEWDTSDNAIWVDFEKLLVARAKHRVFIFQKNVVEKYFKEIEEEIRKFGSTQAGDRYLLAGYSWDSDKFLYKQVIVNI